ncbi:MAG: UPF0149 family protein [Rubrivivax sp.]|nr:UPF0149 family protein [Rubrivivax sp.]
MSLIDNTDAEIEAFDNVCRRLGGFAQRVNAEWADGYLTAVAAGPRAVPQDEWQQRLCGDAFERAFADPDDVAQARSALGARMRVLSKHLDPEALLDEPESLRLQPLVSVWDEGAREQAVRDGWIDAADTGTLLTGALWAEGFFDAMQDFADDWREPGPDDDDPEAFVELLSHVSVLVLPEEHEDFVAHVQRCSPSQLPTREDLLDEACFAIQDLRVWWLDHAPKPPTRHVQATPGRNDPCPCGSGLKYKRCHGRGA